jgi:hypothetical protein
LIFEKLMPIAIFAVGDILILLRKINYIYLPHFTNITFFNVSIRHLCRAFELQNLRPLTAPMHRWEDDKKTYSREIGLYICALG